MIDFVCNSFRWQRQFLMKSQVFDLVDEMRIIQRIFQFLTLIDHVIDKPSAMSFISQYSIYLLDAAVFSD